jgi:hypothetical protein
MTRKVLVLELNKTAAVFRTELSPPAYEGYWEAFHTEIDQDFARACRRAREELDFMPTIKQLRHFLPDRRGREAVEATNRYLAKLEACRPKAWPKQIDRRRGNSEPTPVTELVAPYLGPSDKRH